MRFVADAKIFRADGSAKGKPRIEVMVCRIIATRGYQVDVDVEQRIAQGFDDESGFFVRFATRDTQRIAVAVAVSAELQPAIEFAVMRQQHVRALFVDDPCRTGDVTAPTVPSETVGFATHERRETLDHVGLFRMSPAIFGQSFDHSCTTHPTMMPIHSPHSKEHRMLAIIAKLKVVPGKESEFEKVMLGLAKDVRTMEPGNKMYTLTKSDAGEYLMLELYDSEEALTAHGQTAHFKAAGPKFAGLMAGRPELQRLTVIG